MPPRALWHWYRRSIAHIDAGFWGLQVPECDPSSWHLRDCARDSVKQGRLQVLKGYSDTRDARSSNVSGQSGKVWTLSRVVRAAADAALTAHWGCGNPGLSASPGPSLGHRLFLHSGWQRQRTAEDVTGPERWGPGCACRRQSYHTSGGKVRPCCLQRDQRCYWYL
jgi:hypothetical protein